ncbi:unnamed protein product [Trifolium pratense]|uniref:Uncharacterized protein n=1 Tax=Trifolium pratense TaxID=57577 RepID=A0ACB0LIK0_TRIPR|nr:unnamed protein product [Trifolium pratense]
MASTIVSLISILLICIAIAQGKNTLYTTKEFSVSSSVNNDGICKTIVETQGYICEEHTVTTEDGYILSLQRIPAGRSGKNATKPPVLIHHGLFCDGIIWLLNSPEQSLGFLLADNGFDVWIANGRGTKYSSTHTSLSPNDMAYWDWSWDELAGYDLPAFVHYVYNHTGQKMHYTGHSQGTLIAFAALSQGKFLDMWRSAALLSPIAHMKLIPSKLTRAAADLFLANDLYWLGLHEFVPYQDVAIKLIEGLCNTLGVDCGQILPLITGPNCCINSSRIDFYLSHEPQKTATKNLIHFSQMIRTGKIAKYDYVNPLLNVLHYGQVVPPTYDVTKISSEFPIFLGYGGQDFLSDVEDVKILLNEVNAQNSTNRVVSFKEDYAHIDYIASFNATQGVYDTMISFFNAH